MSDDLLIDQVFNMINNSYEAIYKRNLILSFYWVLSGLSVLYFFILFLLILLKMLNWYNPSVEKYGKGTRS